MKKDSTSGLSPKRLARLLGIGLEHKHEKTPSESDFYAGELLNARLEGILPIDTTIIEELPAILGRLFKDLVLGDRRSLGQVLIDPKADLDVIQRIRIYAKKMASRKEPGAEKTVAVAIYYAAIANAMLFHNMKITTHSYKSLIDSFQRLSDKPWMTTELARLFKKAFKLCRKKCTY
jgi:hypothetical protein